VSDDYGDMGCGHIAAGWCYPCTAAMRAELDRLKARVAELEAAVQDRVCAECGDSALVPRPACASSAQNYGGTRAGAGCGEARVRALETMRRTVDEARERCCRRRRELEAERERVEALTSELESRCPDNGRYILARLRAALNPASQTAGTDTEET
jgi:hypothetical protein